MKNKLPNSNLISDSASKKLKEKAAIFVPNPADIKRGGIAPWRNAKKTSTRK